MNALYTIRVNAQVKMSNEKLMRIDNRVTTLSGKPGNVREVLEEIFSGEKFLLLSSHLGLVDSCRPCIASFQHFAA